MVLDLSVKTVKSRTKESSTPNPFANTHPIIYEHKDTNFFAKMQVFLYKIGVLVMVVSYFFAFFILLQQHSNKL